MNTQNAKYHLGRLYGTKNIRFGVVFDVDPEFNNTESGINLFPKIVADKRTAHYHLLAENDKSFYVAYVSEQNLVEDMSGEPVGHPDMQDLFGPWKMGITRFIFR